MERPNIRAAEHWAFHMEGRPTREVPLRALDPIASSPGRPAPKHLGAAGGQYVSDPDHDHLGPGADLLSAVIGVALSCVLYTADPEPAAGARADERATPPAPVGQPLRTAENWPHRRIRSPSKLFASRAMARW